MHITTTVKNIFIYDFNVPLHKKSHMRTCRILTTTLLLCIATLSSAQSDIFKNYKTRHGIHLSGDILLLTEEKAHPVSNLELGYMIMADPIKSDFFFEIGILGGFAIGDIYNINDSPRISMFSVTVPLNIGYKFNINKFVGISPYFGLYQRINLWGEVKTGGVPRAEYHNLLDNSVFQANRNQLGLETGFRVYLKDFIILGSSIKYDLTDFNNDGSKFITLRQSIGFLF